MHDKELLTLSEVAEYLRVAEKTIHRMVQKGEIPCVKIASQWRFRKDMLDSWLGFENSKPFKNNINKLLEDNPELVPLNKLTDLPFILSEISPGNKESILSQLIKPLVDKKIIKHEKQYLKMLMEREDMMSTAIGEYIAFPHIRETNKNPKGEPFFVIGKCSKGTDYDSIDGKLTHVFFLLISGNVVTHLRILGKLSKMAQSPDVINNIIKSNSANEIYKALLNHNMNN